MRFRQEIQEMLRQRDSELSAEAASPKATRSDGVSSAREPGEIADLSAPRSARVVMSGRTLGSVLAWEFLSRTQRSLRKPPSASIDYVPNFCAIPPYR